MRKAAVKNMHKAEVVSAAAAQTGLKKADVGKALDAILNEIMDQLERGEGVAFKGFGFFLPLKRAAKIGRNIRSGTAVHIPEHYKPSFTPSKEFKQRLKAKSPTKEEGFSPMPF